MDEEKCKKSDARVRFWWDLREELFHADNSIKIKLSQPSKEHTFVWIPLLKIFDISTNIQFRANNILRLAIQTKDDNIYQFLLSKQNFINQELEKTMDSPNRKKFKQLFIEKTVDLNNSNDKKEALEWVAENILKIREIFLR